MISTLPLGVWIAIAACGGAVATWLYSWRFGRRWVEQAVTERTQGLEGVSRRFKLMVDQAFDLVAVTDAAGDIEYVNRAWSRLLGYSPEDMKQRALVDVLHPNDKEAWQRLLDRALRGEPAEETALRFRQPQG